MSNLPMKKSKRFSSENVGVIICGYPSQLASDVARACVKRGFKVLKFGLAGNDAKTEIDVPDVGKVTLVKCSSPDVKNKLGAAIADAQKEGLFPVVADTTNSDGNVRIYNELKVPFVLQSSNGESRLKAIEDTEASKTFALISEDMNKRMAAFDAMWADFGKRFPSIFHDFDLSIKSSEPTMTLRPLMDSFSDIFNQDLSENQVQKISSDEQKKMGVTEGHVSRDYTFKNGSGSSTFTFRQTSNNQEAVAEGITDSIGFLAQRAQQIAKPQVYSILDVAEQGQLLWY